MSECKAKERFLEHNKDHLLVSFSWRDKDRQEPRGKPSDDWVWARLRTEDGKVFWLKDTEIASIPAKTIKWKI